MGSLQWRHNGCDGVSNHRVLIVCSAVCSGGDKGKHQSSASLAFVRGIHRSSVDSPHKGPVTRKMYPFDDVIVILEKKSPFDNGTERYMCTWLYLGGQMFLCVAAIDELGQYCGKTRRVPGVSLFEFLAQPWREMIQEGRISQVIK